MYDKNENSIIQSTMHLPREKHKEFKAIVVFKGLKLNEVYAYLINRYIEENKNILECLNKPL